jgi:hypothetical protein
MSLEQYRGWQREYGDLKKRVVALELELQVGPVTLARRAGGCGDGGGGGRRWLTSLQHLDARVQPIIALTSTAEQAVAVWLCSAA